MIALRALCVLAALVTTTSALAKPKPPKKDETALKIEKRAVQVYIGGDARAAARALEHMSKSCEPPNGCAPRTRARLLVTLGTIRGAGLSDYTAAKQDFLAALALDPDVRPSPALANAELTKTFEEARAEAGAKAPRETETPKETPPDKDKPISVTELFHPEEHEPPPEPKKKTGPEPAPSAPAGPEPRKNWVSVHGMADFAFMSDANICSPGAPSSYFCTDESGARYTGRPQPNDDVSAGFVPSTARLAVGYDRLLFGGLTAGALAGFALPFSGAPEGRSAMFPLHLEARATYTFGPDPYLDEGATRLHPFAFASLGLAEIDSSVVIRVYEIPCGPRAAPACKRDLDAHRRVGRLFGTLGGGVRYRIEGRHALRAAVRTTLVFDQTTFVFSPEVAYEFGL